MKRLSMIMVCLLAMMSASLSVKAQEITIDLMPGWTWISYPKAEVLDVNTALGDFVPAEGDMIQSQYSNSKYIRGRWIGGVTHFMPGWGYKYYSNRTEVVSFVFGEAAPQLTVTTAEPTAITANSAVSGGSITSNDGSYVFVLEKGICWATHSNPTVMNDFHTENGEGPGGFTAEMIDLSPGMVYYVRAYVVTANGTTYGPEKNFTTKNGIPIVYTDSITDVFSNRATCGGLVTDDGGLEVIAKGVCWSTFSNPTINECHTTDGTGLGSFISVIMGLNNNTTYYVRAYATNSIATYYGNEEVFMTPSQEWEGGVLPGVFSISEDQYVHFSQGNLQYQASTNTWRFAENQWEFVGGAEDI